MRKLVLLISVIMILASCGKKPLDRETAKKLLEGRQFDTLKGSFASTPDYVQFTGDQEGYQALVDLNRAGIITCTQSECKSGPSAKGAIYGGGMGGFTYTAGKFVLSEIAGVTQPTPTTAIVEIRLTFEPTPFYSQHKRLLDRLQTGRMVTGFQAQPSLDSQTQPRTQTLDFQLYDDGWRVLNGVRIKY